MALWLLAGDQLGNAADASNPAEESEASAVPATQAADSDGLRVFMPVSVTRPRPRPLVMLQPEKAMVSGVSLKDRTAVPRMTHAEKGGGWKRRGASRVAHPSSPSLSRSWPRHQARLARTSLRHMSEHRKSPALREPVSAISLTLKSFASKSRRSAGTTSPVPRTTCLLRCNFEATARCFRLANGRCRLRRRLGQVPALPSRRARPQARLSRAACPSIGTACTALHGFGTSSRSHARLATERRRCWLASSWTTSIQGRCCQTCPVPRSAPVRDFSLVRSSDASRASPALCSVQAAMPALMRTMMP